MILSFHMPAMIPAILADLGPWEDNDLSYMHPKPTASSIWRQSARIPTLQPSSTAQQVLTEILVKEMVVTMAVL
jgi:hypothetical protein